MRQSRTLNDRSTLLGRRLDSPCLGSGFDLPARELRSAGESQRVGEVHLCFVSRVETSPRVLPAISRVPPALSARDSALRGQCPQSVTDTSAKTHPDPS